MRSGLRASMRKPMPASTRSAFRKYSTETPTPKSSNTPLYLLGAALAAGGAAYYLYASDSDVARQAGSAAKSGKQIAKAAGHFAPSQADYQKVRPRVIYHVNSNITIHITLGLQQNCGDH